jgi:hypothetical protein
MATDAVKVLIVERNGVDLDDAEELNLTASNVPFSAVGFTADNVKDAILEAGGEDVCSGQDELENGDVVIIPRKKQMILFGRLTNTNGKIFNSGKIIVGVN